MSKRKRNNSTNRMDQHDKESEVEYSRTDPANRNDLKEAFTNSKYIYHLLFDNANDAIFMMDFDIFIECNPKTLEMFGCTREQIIGKTPYDPFSPEFQADGCSSRKKALEKITQAVKGQSQSFRWRHIQYDGTPLETQVSLNPIKLGDKTFIQAIVRDITKLKQTEHELKSERDKLRGLMDGINRAGIGIDIIEADYKITFQNNILKNKFGKINGKRCYEHYLGMAGPCEQCPAIQAIREKKAFSTEQKGLDGRYYQIYSAPLLDADGTINKAIEVVLDITGRKQTEKVTKKNSVIIESASDAVIITDVSGNITFWNKGAERIFGYQKEEVQGKSIRIIYKRKDLHVLDTMVKNLLEGKDIPSIEVTCIDKNRQDVEILLSLMTIKDENGNITELVGIAKDIIELKKNRIAIQESQQQFQNLVENMPIVCFTFERDGRILSWNHAAEQIYGYTKAEAVGANAYDLIVTPTTRDATDRVIKDVFDGKTVIGTEWEDRHKDGTIGWRMGNTFPLFNADGSIYCGVNMNIDITERKIVEKALAASVSRYKSLFDNSIEGIGLSKGNSVISVNKALLDIFGYDSVEEFTRIPLLDHIAPESREMIRELLNKRMNNQLTSPLRFEYKILRKDGQIRDLEISSTSVSIEGEQFTQSTFRDITKRKRTEEKLQDYQAKLKSLATELTLAEERERRRIATGIHDDMAQKLVIAKMELQSLGASVADENISASLKSPCDLIEEIIEDTRYLVFELGNAELYHIGLEAAIKSWVKKEIRDKHNLKCEFITEESYLDLDNDTRITLFRTVKELMANTVKYANANTVKVCIQKLDDMVCVSVVDDGIGFDVSKLGASFTPKGGFGLFNIKERIEYLGGRLEIDSVLGEGTNVTMFVPLKQEVAT